MGENICKAHEELIVKVYKELIQLNGKKKKIQLNDVQNTSTDIFPREIFKWPT